MSEQPQPFEIHFDNGDQNYYWWENTLPPGSAECYVKLSGSTISSVTDATNERLPTHAATDDYDQVKVEITGAFESANRLDGEAVTSEGQIWLITGLVAGLNAIRVKISSKAKNAVEWPVPPITEDEYTVEFTFPIVIQATSIDESDERNIYEWASTANVAIIDAALGTELAAIKHLKSLVYPEATIETALDKIRAARLDSERPVREAMVLWGITREAIAEEYGVTVADEDWPQLSSEIQERCEYYSFDQWETSVLTSREDYPEEEATEPDDYRLPVVLTSLHPSTDSLPAYFGLTRTYVENEHGKLTNEQWEYFQKDILNEIGRYLYRDLPEIVHRFERDESYTAPFDARIR